MQRLRAKGGGGRGLLPPVLVALLLGILSAAPANAGIVWRGDFETGDLDQWAYGLQAKDQSRATVVTSPLREGRYAARFEVRPGDNNVAGSGSGERSEVLHVNSVTNGAEGKEQWWAWSTLFQTAPTSDSGWNTWTQFHHTGSTGQSNVYFSIRNKNQLIMVINNGNPSSPTSRSWSLGNLQLNKWYDLIFHVKWSSNSSVGFVEAWVDGVNVVPRTNLATLYPGEGTYIKQGYYRTAQSNTMVLYHDGMRLGESFGDVANGAQPPQPAPQEEQPPPAPTTPAPPEDPPPTSPPPSDPPPPPSPSPDDEAPAPPPPPAPDPLPPPDDQPPPPTPAPPSSEEPAPPPPVSSIRDQQVLTGTVKWTITPNRDVSAVAFFANNRLLRKGPERTHELDTRTMENGRNTVGYWLYDNNGTVVYRSRAIEITVENSRGESAGEPPTKTAPSPSTPASTTAPQKQTVPPTAAPQPVARPKPALRFTKRPKALARKRVLVRGRAAANAVVVVSVKNVRGRTLGMARTKTRANGLFSVPMSLPRWKGHRTLVVRAASTAESGMLRGRTVIRLSHRERARAMRKAVTGR